MEKRTLVKVFSLCIAIIMILPLVLSCGNSENTITANNEIYSIEVNAKKETATAYAAFTEDYVLKNTKAEIYLLAFDMNDKITVDDFASDFEVISSDRISEKISFKFPLYYNVKSRLYSSFALATKNVEGQYTVISTPYYICCPEMLAGNDDLYPEKSSIKGLRTEMITDAATLGISHSIIEVPIENFIELTGGDDKESFIYNGVSHYINAEELKALDKKIISLTNSSINVYLQFVLNTKYNDLPDSKKCLAYSNANDESEHYAINITDDSTFDLYCGLLDFFAERYTKADGQYGFAASYIIGDKVNSATITNNAGGIQNEDYLFAYSTLVRAAYNTLLNTYANGKIYISIDNNFEDLSTELNGNSSAHNFLTDFLQNAQSSGNYYWNVASAVYTEKKSSAISWIEENNEVYVGKTILTPSNINLLTELIETGTYKYDGKMRKIIISDMTINGGENTTEQTQAALYAYSYYLMQKDSRIEAMIYSSHTDLVNSINSSGLWALDTNNVPTRAREIYNVMESIDVIGTDEPSYIKDIIGSEWSDLFRTNKAIIQTRTLIKISETAETKNNMKSTLLYNFVDGDFNAFAPTDNAEYIELAYSEECGNSVLYAVLDRTAVNDFMGIIRKNISSDSFLNSEYISLDILAKLPTENSSCTLLLRLTQAADNANEPPLTYEAKVLYTGNKWDTLTFDFSSFEDKMNKNPVTLSILIQSDDALSNTDGYGISLNSIYIYQKNSTIIAVILITLLVLSVGGAIAFWFFKNYDIVHENQEGTDKADDKEKKSKKILSRKDAKAKEELPPIDNNINKNS